jgi:hypothetical protein
VFLLGYADGSVRAVSNMIKPEILKAIFTIDGMEIIESIDVPKPRPVPLR